VVPVSVFNDHVGLDTKEFEWCSEVCEEGVVAANESTRERERMRRGFCWRINEVTRVASHIRMYGVPRPMR
jgi:hypothetical protein